jgi:ribonuclease Z
MTWLVQSSLVYEPFSDPGLFIDFCFGRRALLFDLGDLTPLSPRQLLRVTHAFVSHTHMDHFAGFDRLLRVCLHRTTPLHLIGPAEFADRVEHKLRAYTLNLLDADSVDFVIVASEFSGAGFDRVCEFHAREAFHRREIPPVRLFPGPLLDEEEFRVEGTVLDHGIPCLAFALEEKLRVNVWRDGLRRLGLPVGPWIREAKRAVRQGASDNTQICVRDDLIISLGELKKDALRTARGQKIALFDGPARAIHCALAIIEGMVPLGIQVRAGLHTGEVERTQTDVHGIAVHIAARVMDTATAGSVLISRTVRDLVAGSGITFDDAGEHSLKGIEETWRLYKVREIA